MTDEALAALNKIVRGLAMIGQAREELTALGEHDKVVVALRNLDAIVAGIRQPVEDALSGDAQELDLVYCGIPGTRNSRIHITMHGYDTTYCERPAGTRLTVSRVPDTRLCKVCRSAVGDVSYLTYHMPTPEEQEAIDKADLAARQGPGAATEADLATAETA